MEQWFICWSITLDKNPSWSRPVSQKVSLTPEPLENFFFQNEAKISNKISRVRCYALFLGYILIWISDGSPKSLCIIFWVYLNISREDLISEIKRDFMVWYHQKQLCCTLFPNHLKCLMVLHARHSSESSRVWKAFEVCPGKWNLCICSKFATPSWIHSCAKTQIQSWLLRSYKALRNVTPNVL